MQKCSKCLFPETYETINFNTKGQCNICSATLVQKNKNKLGLKEKIELKNTSILII